MNRTAIIFDLDGTLADTLRDIAEAMNAALTACHLAVHPVETYRSRVGHGWAHLARESVTGVDVAQIEEVSRLAFQYYQWHLTDYTHLYDGIRPTLQGLSARGIRMAVLSNKPHTLTVAVVERLGCAGMFVAIQGALANVAPKPDPALALAVSDRLGIAPPETFLIGDSAVDVETALRAGMVPVGVTWGFRDRSELVGASPIHIVERPADILRLPGLGGTGRATPATVA
ncbi:MAG TPA: HAD family hydrolase [Phycisphaerae bacterium]|nr:HAD family hydrolase [Phycisphaerae bacterium]